MQGAFSFRTVPLKAKKKAPAKRRAPPNTPAHNFADVAAAIMAMAKIIDPVAFEDDNDALRLMTVARRKEIAEQRIIAVRKARECQQTYDYHLGNERYVTVMIKNGKFVRFVKYKRGKGPTKK